MANVKLIAAGAAVGFLFSFFVGIFSGAVAFGFLILRAVIFGVVGAGIAFGISFLNKKFLSENVESLSVSDIVDHTAGNSVDITIDDENLEEDSSGPRFYVSENSFSAQDSQNYTNIMEENAENLGSAKNFQDAPKNPKSMAQKTQSSNLENLQNPQKSSAEQEKPQEFKPIDFASQTKNAESNVQNSQSQNPKSAKTQNPPQESLSENFNANENPQNLSEIDNLPNLDGLSDISSKENENRDTIEEDEDLPEQAVTRETSFFSQDLNLNQADTKLMAQAIRTVLSKDK